MRNTHEPTDEFVEKLEWQIGLEARRRNRAVHAPQRTSWSRMKTTLVVSGLMLVSMGIGAAAVAAAYEAQDNAVRDQLATSVQQRVDLALKRVAVANEGFQAAQRKFSMGLAKDTEVVDARNKVVEAEAQLKALQLQLEEIRITGRDPRSELSAPRVSGRDFVSERLRIEMSVPEAAVAGERQLLQDTDVRVQIGVAAPIEGDVARVRMLEAQTALETFQRKIDIRQKFLSGGADAVETELRVLEAEAEQRQKTLVPKIDLARKQMEQVKAKVAVGNGQQVDVDEATLRLLQLQTELAKANLDLALVRRQIAQHRAGR